MGYTLKDIRYTVRGQGAGHPIIYPRLLRDASILPKVAFAIEYFERQVGLERRDLDDELLVNFFGDHKLARCLTTALSRSYRYRSRRLEEEVSKTAARRLARSGITAPKLLRMALFDDVNSGRNGFTSPEDRPAAYADFAGRFALRAADIERLLSLDQEEHALLWRVGPIPSPATIVAQFNLGVLEGLLRQSESVELQFQTLPPGALATLTAICTEYGVSTTWDERRLLLTGRRDALGNWSRHGRRLTRALLEVLARGKAAVEGGHATLALPGRQGRLRLTSDVLDSLAGESQELPDWQDDLVATRAILAKVTLEIHRRPGTWTMRRLPELLAERGGVLLPQLELRSGRRRVLLFAVRSQRHGERLAAIAAQATPADPLVFVGAPDALDPFQPLKLACIATADFTPALLDAVAATGTTTGKRAQARSA